MLYTSLARSFDDLAPLRELINKLEQHPEPRGHILGEPLLSRLFEEIRSSAIKNISIFCDNAGVYVNYLVINANQLLIHIYEVKRQMEDRMYLNSKDICLVNNFSALSVWIQELVVFFETLSLRHH